MLQIYYRGKANWENGLKFQVSYLNITLKFLYVWFGPKVKIINVRNVALRFNIMPVTANWQAN